MAETGFSDGAVEVLAEIHRESLIDLAQDFVRIPSENPPGDERPVAEYLAQRLEGAGMHVSFQDVDPHPGGPNVVGTLDTGENGPTLLFNTHLDVVPAGEGWSVPPYAGVIEQSRLYGRGACDAKGPLAAIVIALEAVLRAGVSLQGKIIIAGVVGEEQDQSGTRQLAADGIQADHAIVAEPTQLIPIVAHKGEVYYELTTIGRAAHGSAPQLGVNAVIKMMPVIQGIQDLADQLRQKRHALCGHPTMNLGVIRGGHIPNAVPDRCTIHLDRRLIPGESFDEARGEIEAILDEITKHDATFQAQVKEVARSLPMEIASDTLLVRALRRQTKLVTGTDPGYAGWAATCDANILVNEARIPACVFGPGDLFGQAHKPDESVDIDELVTGAKIYALTILELLGE